MTVRTIYIHIGMHKTGTSAIQQFLSENRELLNTEGFLYPGTVPASHLLGHEIRNRSIADILADPESQANRILNEIGGPLARR